MNSRLGVNGDSQLEEIRENGGAGLPYIIRKAAKLVSYIFHPVFVPVYLVYFIIYIHPYAFAGISALLKSETLITAFVCFTFFPLVTVLLLRGLKFIPSIELKTRQDRIIPLIACAVWYFWVWWVWHNLPYIPHELTLLALTSWLSVAIAPFLNVVMKISLHAISLGVMLTCMSLMVFSGNMEPGLYLSVALLITGLVCTARLIDSDHSQTEMYAGLALGISTTLVINFLFY